MSKYGGLSVSAGNSQWFLQKTLEEHDRSMGHPWMKMIYKQSFTNAQYSAWLARMHAVFAKLEEEQHAKSAMLRNVQDVTLLRTSALEVDLSHFLGAGWRNEAAAIAVASPATQDYLSRLEADAKRNSKILLAHHFLQYNAVLSGGAYLGEMVSQKLALPHGSPGVQFYAFEGVGKNKGPARVQQYLQSFDEIALTPEDREELLAAMRQIYTDTEAMMAEVYDLSPSSPPGEEVQEVLRGSATHLPNEQLEITLAELHRYTGANGGRVLLSIAGEILDVSAGREMYGPGGGYAVLAGRDVTRALGTMSLKPACLDDLAWRPGDSDDQEALDGWIQKLKKRYPVVGRLKGGQPATEARSKI